MVRSGAGSTRAAAAGRLRLGGEATFATNSSKINPTNSGGYQRGSGRVLTVAHNTGAVRRVLIGVDVGLSALKAAAFDASGHLLGHGQRPYRTDQPEPGRAEQDPEQWLDLAGEILREL